MGIINLADTLFVTLIKSLSTEENYTHGNDFFFLFILAVSTLKNKVVSYLALQLENHILSHVQYSL